MTMAERKSNLRLTKDTTYLTFTGELWGVFWESFEENLPRYNGTTLYEQNTIPSKLHCELINSSPVKSRGLWLLILCVGDWCWLYFQAGPAARLSFPKVDLHFGA